MSNGSRHSVGPRRVSHGVILLVLAMLAAVPLLAVGVVRWDAVSDGTVAVYLTFGFNLLIAVVALAVECVRAPFSLAQVHWLFFIVFFCIAPASQFSNGYSNWGYPLTADAYLNNNLLLLLWEALFVLAREVRLRRSPRQDERPSDFDSSLDRVCVSAGAVNALVLVSAACTLAVVALVGFDNLFARSTYDTGLDKAMDLIVGKVVRSVPVFSFAYVFLRRRNHRDCGLQLALSVALLLVSNFPFGMARYNMAFVYGGVALLCIPALRRQRGLFSILFLVAFVVLFPASNVFRTSEFGLGAFAQALGSSLASLDEGFLSADYDAYSLLARAVDFVSAYGITWGRQLLGVALFFVPRSVWAGKPWGSGQTIAEAQGQQYTNLSCPLPAEGVVNFGVVGLAMFAVVVALITRSVDDHAWRRGGGVFVLPLRVHAFLLRLSGGHARNRLLPGRLLRHLQDVIFPRGVALGSWRVERIARRASCCSFGFSVINVLAVSCGSGPVCVGGVRD